MTPIIDKDKCTECGECLDICSKVFALNDADCTEVSRPSNCDGCGDCEGDCPYEAITLIE